MGCNSHGLRCCQAYLKDVFRWRDRDGLVVGDVDIHRSGQDLVGERTEEGHVLLIVSHCPRSQCQSVRHILLVSGMDPDTKKENHTPFEQTSRMSSR